MYICNDVFTVIEPFLNFSSHVGLVSTSKNLHSLLAARLKQKRQVYEFMVRTYKSAPWRSSHPVFGGDKYNYEQFCRWRDSMVGLRYDRRMLKRFVAQLYDDSRLGFTDYMDCICSTYMSTTPSVQRQREKWGRAIAASSYTDYVGISPRFLAAKFYDTFTMDEILDHGV
jgi:hypothetical protein